jgi:hypothetical protein
MEERNSPDFVSEEFSCAVFVKEFQQYRHRRGEERRDKT